MRIRFFSPKFRHKYDEDPATVSSTTVNRGIRSISTRLASTLSVNAIIRTVRRRGIVHRLYLGSSCLGDTGCIRLFEFLDSPAGRECRESLTELFLTQNDIGPRGLLAVAKFLRNNTVLRELCLSGNPLTRDPDIIADFVTALNSSRLCTLQLLHSMSLSDPFVEAFLPRLATPYLRQLDMSAIDMTRAVVPIIVDYIKSPLCRLDRLQCNANSLTLPGARTIINAIDQFNYTLGKVNVDDLHMDEDDGDAEDRAIAWQESWRILSSTTHRNLVNRADVRTDALTLLRCCRGLYLRSGNLHPGASHSFASIASRSRNSHYLEPSLFFKLPTELQLAIMAFIAPALSHQQRVRVIGYAADVATLPTLDPGPIVQRTRSKHLDVIIRGRSERKPSEGSWKPPEWWECSCIPAYRSVCLCLRRWKRERRDIWFTQVACDAWEGNS